MKYEKTAPRQNILIQEEYINIIAWGINYLERLLVKIEKDPKGILSMILDMQNIYTKYLDQANKVDKEYNEICIYMLELEQELLISNKKREYIASFLEQQTVKVKYYEKMINAL